MRRRVPLVVFALASAVVLSACFPVAPAPPPPSCSGRGAAVNLDSPAPGLRLQTGRPFSVCGTGFGLSRGVTFTLHSTPIPLGGIVTDASGLVTGTLQIPADAPEGSHTVEGSSGISTKSAAVTILSDITPPDLSAFSLSPTSVNTDASSGVVTVTAEITDDLAGNAGAGYSSSPSSVRFRSPSGQSVYAMLSDLERTTGTAQNGTVQYAMTVPQFAEHGTWTVEYIYLVDQVGNSRRLTPAQLTTLGYPNSFEQTAL